MLILFCLLDLSLSSEETSWTETVFSCLLLHVVWSRIAPFSKEYELTWLSSVGLERFGCDEVGIALLKFISFKICSYIPEETKKYKKDKSMN